MNHTSKVIFRNSDDGKIVSKTYADNHKKTTEKQIVYTPSPKRGK